MIKNYFSWFGLTLIWISLCINCNKKTENENCLSYSKAFVTKIEGVNTAKVNEEVLISVYFSCYNGCGQFGNFEELTLAQNTIVQVNAKYEGCFCTQDVPTRLVVYTFKKSQPGTYTLNFSKSNSSYITHSIIVQ